jgi:hypothetical protein
MQNPIMNQLAGCSTSVTYVKHSTDGNQLECCNSTGLQDKHLFECCWNYVANQTVHSCSTKMSTNLIMKDVIDILLIILYVVLTLVCLLIILIMIVRYCKCNRHSRIITHHSLNN